MAVTSKRALVTFFIGAIMPVPVSVAVGTALAGIDRDVRYVEACLHDSLEEARARPKKLLLVSGSNARHGISAEQLSERVGVPVVNAACHAGLGRRYILHFARAAFQTGDLVVLPLEYDLYDKDGPATVKLLYVFAHDKRYLYEASFIERIQMLYGGNVTHWLAQLVAARRAISTQAAMPPVSVAAPSWRTPAVDPATDTGKLKRTRMDFAISDESFEELAAFANYVAARGGMAAVAFPSILYDVMDTPANAAFLDRLQARLRSAGITVIGTPAGSFFEIQDISDTIYHVSKLGQVKSTERLAEVLEQSGLLTMLRE